jgi:hypothetical protein
MPVNPLTIIPLRHGRNKHISSEIARFLTHPLVPTCPTVAVPNDTPPVIAGAPGPLPTFKEQSPARLHTGMMDRDERGRFLPGHPGNKPLPGQLQYQHPIYPDRDSRGRLLPGHPQYCYPAHVRRLKLALLSAVSEADLAGAVRELVSLCLDRDNGPAVQLWAIGMFLDYLLGKPTVAVAVMPRPEIPAADRLDFGKLTDEELGELARLLDKARLSRPA